MKVLAIAFVVGLSNLLCWSVSHAGGETPTPSPAATTTPEPEIAAPSDLSISLSEGVVSWVDNSDNEDGFRIRYILSNGDTTTVEFEAPANAESAALPSDTPPLLCTQLLTLDVRAFNAGGESAPDRIITGAACPPPEPTTTTAPAPTATPTTPVTAPDTGSGPTPAPAGGRALIVVAAAALAGASLIAIGRVSALRRRRS